VNWGRDPSPETPGSSCNLSTNWKPSLGPGILSRLLGLDTVRVASVGKSVKTNKNIVFAGCELLFLSLMGLFMVLQMSY